MPTEIVELREYEIEATADGRHVYTFQTATLHKDLEDAHQWVAARIRDEGTGENFRTPFGELPGRTWATTTVEAAEFAVVVGQDMEVDEWPFSGEEEEEFEDDAPLPPDEH